MRCPSGRPSCSPAATAARPRPNGNRWALALVDVCVRAALYDRYGAAADVLRVVECDRPEPGPGEVRVRIAVSGVNPTDWKARTGRPGAALPFPFLVPNQDGAGVIDAVGTGVDRKRVGQRVWLYHASWQRQWGTAAEWIVVPDALAVALPDTASFDLGATLGIPAMTAHRCLFADGPVDGLTVLVAGGAGAVGHAAIQLARRDGARVISTVSSDAKAAIATAAGAHHVVNYRDGDARDQIRAAAPESVHRIVEVALTTNADLDRAVLAGNGTIVTYANEPTDPVLPTLGLMFANTTLRYVLVYRMPPAAISQAVGDVTAAAAAGDLTLLPVHRFPLEEIAAAHDAVENGAVGKVLVDVSEPA
jgi:NADPH2:quinone reductase